MEVIALIAGLVALAMAQSARKRASALEADLRRHATRVSELQDEVERLQASAPERRAAEDVVAPAPEVVVGDAEPEAQPPSDAAETSDEAPPVPIAPAASATSLEERLGTRWAVWVGGLALALGGVLLVRYSIEQGIFGPGVRIAMGTLFSFALLAAGEWFRRSERGLPVDVLPAAHIPSILTGAGTISAFGTVYAAHALYNFIGPGPAFVLLGLIGVGTMFAAALHGPALAGIGLAGSFVVPMLVSSPTPNPWPLVIYLIAVAGAAYALARLRRWLWLASAVVVGVFLWGLALLGPAAMPGGEWASALFVHAAAQLVLAAFFMAIEPHVGVTDENATPDWIASLALAALTCLAIFALAVARYDTQWTLFAIVAIATLVLTAWRSVPAAAAATLGGLLALGAILAWPGLAAPPENSQLSPIVTGVLRLPENVANFLVFTAAASLAVAAASALRLWRGRALSVPLAALYALAAIVIPLLALVLAYLRVTQFDRSISFAFFAVILAGVFYLIADRFDKIPAADKTAATHLAVGTFAAGVAAAMALAFVMALDRGYLTVAFAVTAFTTAYFAVVDRIPLLRYVVVAIGLIVLGRLVWDPAIMGADVGAIPILNWLLLGYGAPALAFLGTGHILKREGEDLAVRICDALGVLFAALLMFFQIRHALNGGNPLAQASGHVEQGLFALMSFGFAYVLMRMDQGRSNIVFRFASLAFGVISAVQVVFGLGLFENPLFAGDPVRGSTVFSSLLLAYLLPGAAAVLLARAARGVRPNWYVTGIAVLAILLLFGYVTLEVRHAFQGENLSIWKETTAAEVWAYSAAWLALGLVFLAYGIVRGSREARLASAALVVLSVVKVFLYDLTGITGLWRALSVICLGVVLIGIGLVYQKLIFARPRGPAGT